MKGSSISISIAFAATLFVAITTPPVYASDSISVVHKLCMQSMSTTTMPKSDSVEFCSCLVGRVVQSITPAQSKVLLDTSELVNSGQQPNPELLQAAGIKNLISNSQAYCGSYLYENTGALSDGARKRNKVLSNQSVQEFSSFMDSKCPAHDKSKRSSACKRQAAKDWLTGSGRKYDVIPYPYITGNSLATTLLTNDL